MKNEGIYVGVDIGTTSIRVSVAEVAKGELNVLGVGSADSAGVDRGVIVDIDQAVLALQKAIKQAQKVTNVEIKDVYLAVPANLLEIVPCSGLISIPERQGTAGGEITDKDVVNVAREAVRQTLSADREIIDVVPLEFSVDGADNVVDPRGMLGMRLQMNGVMYTGPKTVLHNLCTTAKRANLHVAGCVVAPIAASEIALKDDQKDFGGIVIELGGGQTTAAVMYNHNLRFTYVDREGGEYVTRDISVVLNTSLENAENIKRAYGQAQASAASSSETFPVAVVGQQDPKQVSEEYLAEIIEARLVQIFTKIKRQLDRVNALSLPGGVVLTGGLAAMNGVSDLAARIFGVPVSYYYPEVMGMRHPIFTDVLGIINYVTGLSDVAQLVHSVLPTQQGQQAQTAQATQVQPAPQAAPEVPQNSRQWLRMARQKPAKRTAAKQAEPTNKQPKRKKRSFISNILVHLFDEDESKR